MAITTFSELKTAIENWAINTDHTARLEEFIALAESRINKDVRVRDLITTTDITVNAQSVAVPTGFLAPQRFYLDTATKIVLDYVTLDFLYSSEGGSSSGKPLMYSVEGSNFIFAPIPDSSYTGKLSYYKRVPALSDSQTTNNVLTNAPDVYLYACLLEMSLYLFDDEGAAKWRALYDQARKDYELADKRDSFPDTPIRSRVGRVV